MYGVDGVMRDIIGDRTGDPKPERYVELLTAMQNRKISLATMNHVCLAIGSLMVADGKVRRNRPLPRDPGSIGKEASGGVLQRWKADRDSYMFAIDQNRSDAEFMEKIEASMGDAYELTEDEEKWVNYILTGER